MEEINPCTLTVCRHNKVHFINNCEVADIQVDECQFYQAWNTRQTPDSNLTFNPDWDMLEASQGALRECMGELSKYADLTKDIEGIIWVGECLDCKWKQTPIIVGGKSDTPCPKCNGGTGEIERPATLDEVVEMSWHMVEILQLLIPRQSKDEAGEGVKQAMEDALEINNGKLKINT